jgi:hypothetical protein
MAPAGTARTSAMSNTTASALRRLTVVVRRWGRNAASWSLMPVVLGRRRGIGDGRNAW